MTVHFYTAREAAICTYINHFRRTHRAEFWAAVAATAAKNAGTINAGRGNAFMMVCDKVFYAYYRAKRAGHSLATGAVYASARLRADARLAKTALGTAA